MSACCVLTRRPVLPPVYPPIRRPQLWCERDEARFEVGALSSPGRVERQDSGSSSAERGSAGRHLGAAGGGGSSSAERRAGARGGSGSGGPTPAADLAADATSTSSWREASHTNGSSANGSGGGSSSKAAALARMRPRQLLRLGLLMAVTMVSRPARLQPLLAGVQGAPAAPHPLRPHPLLAGRTPACLVAPAPCRRRTTPWPLSPSPTG